MNNFLKIVKTLIFTNRCKICGCIIEFDEELCNDCKHIETIKAPLCLKCGCSKDECSCHNHRGKKRDVEYKAVIAPYYYENSIQQAVLNFKMHDMPFLAEMQGIEISKAVKLHYELVDFDFITYIPMLKKDEYKREFNQSKLLAEVVSRECGIPLSDALIKVKKTKKQKRQNANDRFLNVYNAFKVRDGTDIANARVLLIDDVKTTGATLNSASMTLKAYGAKSVYCATFALIKK